MTGAIDRGWILAGVAVLSLLLLGASANGAVRKVPQKYPTIQAAVDAANPGDKIEVSKKKNFENVTVSTPRLVIKGVKRGVIVDGYLEPGGHGRQFEINANRVRIANLELRNGSGIDCNASDRCVASKVRFTGQSQSDCFYSAGDRAQVLRSNLGACDDRGVEIYGHKSRVLNNTIRLTNSDCIYLATADDVVVRGNVIRNCEDGDGIEAGGDNALIEANRIANVDGSLIFATGPDARILRNRGSGAAAVCFFVVSDKGRVQGNSASACDGGLEYFGQNPKIIGNRLANLNGTGIDFDCATSCGNAVLKNNVVRSAYSDHYGIDASVSFGAGSALIQGNLVVDAADTAFNLLLNDARVLGNTARSSAYEHEEVFYLAGENVKMKRNKAIGGGGDGFYISGDDNLLEDNVARKNYGDGFEIGMYSENRVIGNVALRNGADGIENRGAQTILRGNRASGNRRDCANDGTIASKKRNRCADGSNFNKEGTARQSERHG